MTLKCQIWDNIDTECKIKDIENVRRKQRRFAILSAK